jgi:hypothetical protein
MKSIKSYYSLLLLVIIFLSCSKKVELFPQAETTLANGDISIDIINFKNSLGSLNTTIGIQGGRREINWDAIADSFATRSLPADFFNPTGSNAVLSRQRGMVYKTLGNYRVSATSFSESSTQAVAGLLAFSGSKLFADVSSSEWQVEFQVPGEKTAAAVNAFGLVFVGVDLPNTSYIELWNGNLSLGKYYAQPQDSQSAFSFVGVKFKDEIITAVTVVHGNASINSNEKDISVGGTKDIVALDDFIYSEPKKI